MFNFSVTIVNQEIGFFHDCYAVSVTIPICDFNLARKTALKKLASNFKDGFHDIEVRSVELVAKFRKGYGWIEI